MVRFDFFGHDAQGGPGNCVYSDNHEPVDFFNPRPCPCCGEVMTAKGHDPCIANLPGVKAACCGHGRVDGYVLFENNVIVRGKFSTLDSRQIDS